MKRNIIIAVVLVVAVGLAFSSYKHMQTVRRDAELDIAIEQARQKQEIAEAKRIEEEKAAKEAALQALAEKNRAIDEAWEFITAKFPLLVSNSYSTVKEGWFSDTTTWHYYKRKYELKLIDRSRVVYRETTYGDTSSSASTGPVTSVETHEFDLSEVDPTRIEASGGSYGSVTLNIRANRELIKSTYKSNSGYTRSVTLHVDDSSDSERVARQMGRAFYQLVTACGGHGEKF